MLSLNSVKVPESDRNRCWLGKTMTRLELVRLYRERWEIEVAYLALRHFLLGGYVLRSRDRAGAEQELWALLAVYQALRMAMTAAGGRA